MDAAGACDGLLPSHCGDRDLHTGAAQNIHAEQALAFLQPGGKKITALDIANISLFSQTDGILS